ncbi:MAG TPA: sulfurtransferase complex subunit TusC [Gammaproteobacteria bacterium]
MEDFPEEYEGGVVKKFAYVNRRAPHGTIYAQEALEVVLVGAAFDQDVSMVFLDDGVYQIRKDQDTSGIGTKNFSKTFRALEMYDVEKLYVEKESMDARGMTVDDLSVPVEVKTSEEIGRLLEEQDVILSF